MVVAAPTTEVQLETVAPAASYAYKGFSGRGFVETSTTKNTVLSIPVTVAEAGVYARGFSRTRTVMVPSILIINALSAPLRNGPAQLGTIVLPQRGVDEWSNWGFTNAVRVQLPKGTTTLTLAYEPANANMNGAVNQAMLDYLRLRKLAN
ncbi:MAG: hypothetical protein WKG07_46815 [Hymenobacter sp.]